MQYRKKPVVIEALQLNEANKDAILSWSTKAAPIIIVTGDEGHGVFVKYADIHTLEGVVTANLNHWIIKGIAGEVYPCRPDIFEATYEPLTTSALHNPPEQRECEHVWKKEDNTIGGWSIGTKDVCTKCGATSLPFVTPPK